MFVGIDKQWVKDNYHGEKNFAVPAVATYICRDAFYRCAYLEMITIPDGVTGIGSWAFSKCESLKIITFPDSLTTIGSFTFEGCKSLESITIPDSITEIGNGAFFDCKAEIMYKGNTYPSFVFDDKKTLSFLQIPTFENLMKIEDARIKPRLALNSIESDISSEHEKFLNYVKNHCDVLIKTAVENNDWKTLDTVFNSEHKLLRPKQLEECLQFAREHDYHELSVLLMHYKEDTGRYDKDDRFELEL